jgi:hypothetical protein
MAVRLSSDVRTFDTVTPEAVMTAAAVLGVPATVALRAARDVCNRVFKAFDRLYAEHYPSEPGLLSKSTPPAFRSAAEALADTQDLGEQEEALALGVRHHAQPALERRILRILRYLILPEMRARLPS